MRLNIIIAEEHTAIIEGTRFILKSGFPEASIDAVNSYPKLMSFMARNHYDFLLLDVDILGTKFRKTLEELRLLNPKIIIIIFSIYNEQIVSKYINAGADGYINKLYPEKEILPVINSILSARKNSLRILNLIAKEIEANQKI